MTLEDLALEHQRRQLELIKRNANPCTRNKDELIEGLRHGLAGWILCEATERQLFEIVDRNRTSHNN